MGTTNNDNGREVDLTDELPRMPAAQAARVQALEKQFGRVMPYLLPRLRSAVQRMVNLRVPERAALTLTRHKTRPVFGRSLPHREPGGPPRGRRPARW